MGYAVGQKAFSLKTPPFIGNVCHTVDFEVCVMATMNISLPNAMKQWVEQQAQSGRYSNSSDYMRDLIRRDQEKALKIANMQALVTEGIESGAGTRTMDMLRVTAQKQSSTT
jgi:antitoxin ParD1/3/4